MPFDTEKERRPLKVWEWSFSWRQVGYMSIGLLVFMQMVQWTYNGSLPYYMNILSFFLCLMLFAPAVIFSFLRNTNSGHFMDKHLLYYYRHKKRESGVWRRF